MTMRRNREIPERACVSNDPHLARRLEIAAENEVATVAKFPANRQTPAR